SLAPGWRKGTLRHGCQHMRARAPITVAGKSRHAAQKPAAALFAPSRKGDGRALRGKEKPGSRVDLNALAFHLAGKLVHELLAARPIGVDLKQLFEGFEGSLFLADLAQDLAEPIKGLEMIGIKRQGAAQIPEGQFNLVAHKMHIGAAIPGLREV